MSPATVVHRAGCAVVGSGVVGHGPGIDGRWVERCRRPAAALFDAVAEPVSALAAVGAADRWVMSLTFVVVGACFFVTALALRPGGSGAAAPHGRGRGGHAGRGEPRASRDQVSGGPHDLRGGWVHRRSGLASRGLAAWVLGAVGVAAGGVGYCRRGITDSGGLVRRGADYRWRAGWPGRTHLRVRAGAVAARRRHILPSCRQDRRQTGAGRR